MVPRVAPIRVVIVDDHAMVRRGMRDFLGLHDDLQVVGEAADGLAALEVVAATRPDVVIMDLLRPALDGIEATRRIKAAQPEVEVVALTSFIEEERVVAAIEAGAAGFLLKDAEADDLAAAIRAAAAGEVHLDPAQVHDRRRRIGSQLLAAPEDRPDPSGQLPETERLGDVVVGAKLQAKDLVDLVVLGRQHHDRDPRLGPDDPADLDARELRQHEVQEHEVGAFGPEPDERLAAVGRGDDLESIGLEGFGERLAERRFVFDDEDAAGHRLRW
jgi:DNA-binding NarL/FixJ family response regulator